MKKTIILIAITAGFTTVGFAQKKEKDDDDNKGKRVTVPAAVKNAFAKQYPGSVAKWEKENGKYEVELKNNGQKMSVLYELNGSVAETEVEIKINELPAAVRSYVKTKYMASITEASKITKADGTVNYEAEVKKTDVLFDANGNFLKESKE